VTLEKALRFVPAAGASAIGLGVVATRPLPLVWRVIALAAIAAAWIAAIAFQRREVGMHASVVSAIAAVIAAGQVDAGRGYGVGAGLFLLGCLVAMRRARYSERVQGPSTRAGLRASARLAASGGAVAAGLIVALPPLETRVERFVVDRMFGIEGDEATAFSTTMTLGSTRGMLQSDAIVLRIEGERPAYLRGAVYDRYDGHFWLMSGGARMLHPVRADAGRGTTRITLVRGAPNGPDMRWFLPPGACDLGLPEGTVQADAFGVARRGGGPEPRAIDLRTSGCSSARPPLDVTPPSDLDRSLSHDLAVALDPIAATFTRGASTPRAELDLIQRGLSTFEYSLSVARDERLDPIVDFLTVHRAGHCEMFASAMVLLARARGIPARVVGGYRVTEVNPLTGRAVVRDKNAHAWVEAWIDGAWHAWDPTPSTETFAAKPSWLSLVSDVLSSWGDGAAERLARIGTLGLVAVFAGVAALLLFVRWARARLGGPRGRKRRDGLVAPSLPSFDRLVAALEAQGLARESSEPIEAFARRLDAEGTAWAKSAAAALLDYAGLRYGGVGDEPEVVRSVERATSAVAAVTPSASLARGRP
jgi:hypothetical protein